MCRSVILLAFGRRICAVDPPSQQGGDLGEIPHAESIRCARRERTVGELIFSLVPFGF